jgi:hypothetical protein
MRRGHSRTLFESLRQVHTASNRRAGARTGLTTLARDVACLRRAVLLVEIRNRNKLQTVESDSDRFQSQMIPSNGFVVEAFEIKLRNH